jgi:hypothetical protein
LTHVQTIRKDETSKIHSSNGATLITMPHWLVVDFGILHSSLLVVNSHVKKKFD